MTMLNKTWKKAKLCYMDTGSFIVYIKTEGIYADVFADDIEARFDISNYELDRQLPKGKNEKVIGLMKDELGEKIMKRSAASRKQRRSIRHKKMRHQEKTYFGRLRKIV